MRFFYRRQINQRMDVWMGGRGGWREPRGGPSLWVSIEQRLHRRLVAVKCGRHQTGLRGVFSDPTIVSEGLFSGLLSHYAVMAAIFCSGIWLFFLRGDACQDDSKSSAVYLETNCLEKFAPLVAFLVGSQSSSGCGGERISRFGAFVSETASSYPTSLEIPPSGALKTLWTFHELIFSGREQCVSLRYEMRNP